MGVEEGEPSKEEALDGDAAGDGDNAEEKSFGPKKGGGEGLICVSLFLTMRRWDSYRRGRKRRHDSDSRREREGRERRFEEFLLLLGRVACCLDTDWEGARLEEGATRLQCWHVPEPGCSKPQHYVLLQDALFLSEKHSVTESRR